MMDSWPCAVDGCGSGGGGAVMGLSVVPGNTSCICGRAAALRIIVYWSGDTEVASWARPSVHQGNANTTTITDALHRTMTQFADALQQTIQMGVDTQAEENKNARLDKQFNKIKIFDGSNPAECHPWLEEVHALCTQMGRPFKEMLLLCAGQAV